MDKSFGAKFVDLLFKNGQILGLFFAFLVIGGAIAFATSVPKGFPEVNINVAFITAPYPGATANQVETQVIRPIEQVVADIKSITEYSSVASDSFGTITVTFDEKADYQDALRDLSSKVGRVKLPDGAEDPEVNEVDISGGFDFLVAVTGPTDAYELYQKANFVRDQLEAVKGVGKVEIANPIAPTIEIEFRQNDLNSRGLTRAQVEGIIQGAQLDIPVGSLRESDENKINLGVATTLSSPRDVEEILIAPNTRLRDVANVSFVMDNDDQYNRIGYSLIDSEDLKDNSHLTVARALVLSAKFESDANVLAVDETLADEYDDIEHRVELEGDVEIVPLFTLADSTRDQVNEIKAGLFGQSIEDWGPIGVLGYLFGGIGLVVLLLLIFINWRVALLAAFSIPLALAVAAMTLKFMGIELNTLVLFSMVLVIGLVVDPTIVFLESLHRYRNQGYRSREAAIKTINSVGWGVALSAVTNFLVFVPFGVVSGFFGQIIKYIPITVIPAVIASFLVPAIFFMPVAAKWLKRKQVDAIEEDNELEGTWALGRWFGKLVSSLLAPGKLKAFLRVMVVVIGLTLPFGVAGSLISSGNLQFVQFSSNDDSTALLVYGSVNKNWSFDKAVKSVVPVQEYLSAQPEIYNFSYYQQNGNSFTLFVNLWPIEVRADKEMRTAVELAHDINDYFDGRAGIEIEAAVDSEGPPADRYPVQVTLFDNDLERLKDVAKDVTKYLEDQEDVTKVADSLSENSDGVSGSSLVLDRDSLYSLNPFSVIGVLKDKLDVKELATFELNNEDWKLVTKYDETLTNLDQVRDVSLPPLAPRLPGSKVSDVVFETKEATTSNIQRLDGKRFVRIKAQVEDGVDPLQVQADLNEYLSADKLDELGLDEDALQVGGEADAIASSFTDLLVALVIALFIIYVLLVAFFRSLVAPMIIMTAIPLGLVGAFPAVSAVTGQLGFLELLGVVAMAGVVVNVTILMIDFANQLVNQGMTVQQAISTSIAVRYKAIFLTQMTIFGGLMPLAIYSPFWRGLALVIIFGIIASAVLSIFTTPILYVWSKGKIARKKRQPVVEEAPVYQAPVVEEPVQKSEENYTPPSEGEIRDMIQRIVQNRDNLDQNQENR